LAGAAAHPRWGTRKLKAFLEREGTPMPAASAAREPGQDSARVLAVDRDARQYDPEQAHARHLAEVHPRQRQVESQMTIFV
jgi:hypothetical protein